MQLARYLALIETAIEEEFERAMSPSACNQLQPSAGPRYNLQYLETYWEWLADDPIAVVENLWHSLSNFASTAEGRPYGDPRVRNETNALVIYADTAPGVRLKIYSKTNRRVRIEVAHTLTGSDRFQFSRKRSAGGSSTNAHTFLGITGLVAGASRLREHAARTVNRFLVHHRRQGLPILRGPTGYQALLHIFFRLSDDWESAMTIAQALVHNLKFVVTPETPSPIRAAINALRAGGIVLRDPTSSSSKSRYLVTALYQPAFAALNTNRVALMGDALPARSRRASRG